VNDLLAMKLWETIAGMRDVPEDDIERFKTIRSEVEAEVVGLREAVKDKD